MRLLAVLIVLLPVAAAAGPMPCGEERTARARIQCLRARVAVVRNRIDSEIASVTAGLDDTAGPGSRRFGRDLRRGQRGWKRRTDRACRTGGGDPVTVEICRLAATWRRRVHVRDLLSDARRQAGLPTLPRLSGDIEIWIALPRPPGGADLELTLPVPVPDP